MTHLQRALELAERGRWKVRDAGASLFVAGSSIFGREDITRAYRRLVQDLA